MSVFDLVRGNTLLILAAGFACSLLVLLLGRNFFGGRRGSPQTLLPEEGNTDAVPKSGGERRASLRRRGRVVQVLVADEEKESSPVEGLVVDRSGGGLCIALAQPLPAGTILSVRACEASTATPWVKAEVRHCHPQGDSWEHGCAFVSTPAWGVLLQFG